MSVYVSLYWYFELSSQKSGVTGITMKQSDTHREGLCTYMYKYEKHFQKMLRAVPKPQKLDMVVAVCRQERVYKDYTSNPIPTSFFYP